MATDRETGPRWNELTLGTRTHGGVVASSVSSHLPARHRPSLAISVRTTFARLCSAGVEVCVAGAVGPAG